MNVEIGPEAALFPEKEYINGIAVAVHTFFRYFRVPDLLFKSFRIRLRFESSPNLTLT
jgi:hypothetical protein